jgi:hypothetical protein
MRAQEQGRAPPLIEMGMEIRAGWWPTRRKAEKTRPDIVLQLGAEFGRAPAFVMAGMACIRMRKRVKWRKRFGNGMCENG